MFKYVSLFSGIGGFEQALNKLGGKCVMASEFDKLVEAGISNSQLYKMAGNAVTVNVIEAIANGIIEYL